MAGVGGTAGIDPPPVLPTPTDLPVPAGPCPEFVDGTLPFYPAGQNPREATVWLAPDAFTREGPLVFYWYGTNGDDDEARWALSTTTIAEIHAEGGIVVVPHHDRSAGLTYSWHFAEITGSEDDIELGDEVVACAIEKVGIDVRRIHSLGLSAGAMHTSQMAFRRSNYMASVVSYSGGFTNYWSDMPNPDPNNKFAALITHGGPFDTGGALNFMECSTVMHNKMVAEGHFSIICDSGEGHGIPRDVKSVAWSFLRDHPYGTVPSPYAAGLPIGFPTWCRGEGGS
jgi:hypothetical protein